MKKLNLAIICSLFLVSGCNDALPPEPMNYVMPDDLKDCKVTKIDGNGPFLFVVRCPNSATSTQWVENHGKSSNTYTSVYIDGAEYVKATKEPEVKKANTITVNGIEYQKVEKVK